jgi:hypothetical protein
MKSHKASLTRVGQANPRGRFFIAMGAEGFKYLFAYLAKSTLVALISAYVSDNCRFCFSTSVFNASILFKIFARVDGIFA